MDTGAPMDTAESAKVSHHEVLNETVKLNYILNRVAKGVGVISVIHGPGSTSESLV